MSDVIIRLEQASTDAVDWMRQNRKYVVELAAERDQLKAELATLRESEDAAQHAAKRAVDELANLQDEREPRDNGDGTVTAMLPVTFPKGLDVIEVRSRKAGDMFAHWNGERVAVDRDGDPENVWLILRPAPKPPEPVTWEAPLCDGEWIAWQDYAEFIGNRRQWFVWFGTVRGLERPAKLGRYGFASGVGALVEEYGNV